MGYQQLPVTHIEETALIDGRPSVAMILSAVASLAGSRETCIPTWEIIAAPLKTQYTVFVPDSLGSDVTRISCECRIIKISQM